MTSVGLKACALACVFVAIALAQSVSIPPMDHLKASETLQAAKLRSTEIKQICEQLETTSFDVPDSWETELRGRRVSLGNEKGLVIQGIELLCGGTGNCQTWVLRRSNGKWLTMFKDQAPIASAFGFQPKTHAGHKTSLLQPTARQIQKTTSSTTLTASSIARLSATRFTRAGQSTPRSSLANDRHFLSEVLFGAGGLPAAPFAHFANVFRYG